MDPWLHLEQLRWGGHPPACVVCGTGGRCTALPAAASGRRSWRCGACRARFSVLSGTLLEGTRMSLSAWVAIVAALVSDDPPSIRALARRHAVTSESVRLIRARLAAAGVTVAAVGDDAMGTLLRLGSDEVERVRATLPRRGETRSGPSAAYH